MMLKLHENALPVDVEKPHAVVTSAEKKLQPILISQSEYLLANFGCIEKPLVLAN